MGLVASESKSEEMAKCDARAGVGYKSIADSVEELEILENVG